MSDEPVIPLDDMALDAPEGNFAPINGEFTLSQLLNFWSGYDPSKSV